MREGPAKRNDGSVMSSHARVAALALTALSLSLLAAATSASARPAVGGAARRIGTQTLLAQSHRDRPKWPPWHFAHRPPPVSKPQAWSILPTPSLGEREGELAGISCVSTSFCVAAGSSTLAFKHREPLLELWTGGAWSVVPAIAPAPSAPNSGTGLNGVSCVSASSCVAVGAGEEIGPSPELGPVVVIDTWNGVTWSESETRGSKDDLTGVSCVSASFCAAVGMHNNQGSPSPITGLWNGTTWRLAQESNLGSLVGVSCASATFCVAVGNQFGGAAPESLIESWNGTAWSIVPGPQRATGGNGLESVSCTSPASCVAVGGNNTAGPLVERWNGTAWSIVPTPGAEGDTAAAVSCLSVGTCTVVGHESTASGTDPLVTSLDGERSSAIPTAAGLGSTSEFQGVSCLPDGLCAAVGSDETGSEGPISTLVEYGKI
jgi:hypothetical protein